MLNNLELQSYFDNGFLVVEDLISSDVLDRIHRSYNVRLGQLEKLLLLETEHKSFKSRMFKMYEQSGTTNSQFFNIALPLNGINEKTPCFLSDSVFFLLIHPKILSIVQQLLGGSEILLNPIQSARIKPPIVNLPQADINNPYAAQVDWHQDSAELMPIAQIYTRFVTAWVALHDVEIDDGCLMFLPGSHRRGINLHCRTPWNGIRLKRPVHENYVQPVPVKKGSVLFYDCLTLHCGLANKGNNIRQSFDFRYQLANQPTGRDIFPSFLLRSEKGEKVLRSPDKWRDIWRYYKQKLIQTPLHKNFYMWWPEMHKDIE